MLISCNRLKNYIKDSQKIDWFSIWDKFSIRTAEVEGVTVKGKDIDGVVVAEIVECEKVPDSKKLHKLLVDNGKEKLQIICGAPNVRIGLKAPLVNVGGHVCGLKITSRKLAGLESFGMMCSAEELGFAENCEGILELPDDYIVGKDIKEYLPLEDIIVEIDNKSLTNRPDLWGHYGIAREIAAITSHELLPLDLVEIPNNKKDLDIRIKNPLCLRYTGLKIDNISNKQTPLDMQIFLYYTGMRSISLIVDLTNYLMLELGQPMHAFDARKVNSIEIDMAKNEDKFYTLDNIERTLNSHILMIKKNKDYFAVAGVMGGLDSEILEDTTAIILESATFDAASIRRAATYLGLRTEASARYEKSLDPNMTIIATKRFAKLLQEVDKEIEFASNITDVYPNPLKEKKIILKKETLRKYMNIDISADFIVKTLTTLGFKVKEKKDSYDITVPTYRATKDISLQADIIEEIARMYGYENIRPEPLKLELTFGELEHTQEKEYEVKRLLATKFALNEVHTYLWYKTAFLNKLGITKDNIKLLGKSEDNILRDDLCLSLMEVAQNNLKYQNKVGIFEIGTEFINGENKRVLSITLADNIKAIEYNFYKLKEIIVTIFKTFYNLNVTFKKEKSFDYYNEDLSFSINVASDRVGRINVVKSNISSSLSKKKCFLTASVDFDKYEKLTKQEYLYENVSKYPTVSLDYTIIMSKDKKYEVLEKALGDFKSKIIKNLQFIERYSGEKENKYTIRYIVGSDEATLTSDELQDFREKFINHIKKNGFSIIE